MEKRLCSYKGCQEIGYDPISFTLFGNTFNFWACSVHLTDLEVIITGTGHDNEDGSMPFKYSFKVSI